MRTALHNGYGTVASMCLALGVPSHGDGLDLLTEQSSLFNKLAMAAPEIAYSLLENFYTVKNERWAFWIIDEITLYRTQFSKHFSYCPECLRDELISVFQDIENLHVCPLHRTLLVKHCPNCNVSELWVNAHLLFCKCGFDRRNHQCQNGTLLNGEWLETFGPEAKIQQLAHMAQMAQTCEDIWSSRKPNDEINSCFFMESVRKHASKMITSQIAKYPGFTLSMHLSPWISSHPLLTALAEEALKEPFTLNVNCINGACCADVELTLNEIIYSAGDWKNRSGVKKLISENFETHQHGSAQPYYRCHTPICRLTRFTRDNNPDLKSEKEALESDYISISDTAMLLCCSSSTVSQLVKLEYLIKSNKKRKSGNGYFILLEKPSVENFNNSYILASKIARLLKTTSIQTTRILNHLGITKAHSKLGPIVYEKDRILAIWDTLEEKLKKPLQLFPIVLPPIQCIDNIIKLANTNIHPKETTSLTRASSRPQISENNTCRFSMNQASIFLNISSRLLYHRFVITGLINPSTIDHAPCFSLVQIQAMSAHLQQHLSIEQTTKILRSGYNKTISLINSFELKPSCALAYSTGDIQLFYDQCDIYELKHRLQNKHKERQ